MTTKEENFLNMAHTVNAVLDRYKADWLSKQRFAAGAKQLNTLLGQSVIKTASAEIVSTGTTKDKHEAGYEAVVLAVKLAKRTSVYALDNKNMTLHDQLRVSKKSLVSRHDRETVDKLRDIINSITSVINALQDYSVLDTDLVQLRTLTDNFEVMVSKPREVISSRKTINDSIPGLLNEIRKTLYELDSLINIFDETPFEGDYLNARKIIDLGRRGDKPDEEDAPPLAG